MILLFKLTVFGVCLSLLYGWCLEMFITRIFSINENHDNHFAISILLGTAFLSGLLGFWSLFFRIDTFTVKVFLGFVVLILGLSLKYSISRVRILFQQIYEFGLISWICFAVFLIFSLYLAASSTVTYDTGLYHAQSIHWIETYPVVKGIANIHDRLGFNSSLFLLAAFFGFAEEGWHSYQVPGLIIFVGFSLYSIYLMGKYKNVWALSKWVAGGFFVYLWLEKGMIVWFASPTADLSSAFISWAIFLLTMEYLEENQFQQTDSKIATLLVLCLFNITLKISSLPIILAGFYFMWKAGRDILPKAMTIFLLMDLVIFVPWILRNIFISGYLVFPFYQLDILSVDWKVPHDAAMVASETIRAWGFVPYQRPSLVMSMGFSEWFPKWCGSLPLADKTVLYLILTGLIALLIYLFYAGIREFNRYFPVYFVMIFWCVYWFTQSPSPRFGYGFLIPLLLLQIAPWFNFILLKTNILPELGSTMFCLVLGLYVIYCAQQYPLKSWKHYINTYKTYPAIETFSKKVEKVDIYIPIINQQSIIVQDAQCWYDPFPCAPFPVQGLSMRGQTIEDGFYINIKGNQ